MKVKGSFPICMRRRQYIAEALTITTHSHTEVYTIDMSGLMLLILMLVHSDHTALKSISNPSVTPLQRRVDSSALKREPGGALSRNGRNVSNGSRIF